MRMSDRSNAIPESNRFLRAATVVLAWSACATVSLADESFALRRCEVLPLPDHQVSMRVDGVEKIRWHFGGQYPRPFFYPFCGPSGGVLTRMGHPGAQNHDHHRSVWFAHKNVDGQDFWSDGKGTQIRQKLWYCYQDGDDEAVMASGLVWYGEDGKPRLDQEVVAALIPLSDGECGLEIQMTMSPAGKLESIELGKTNFGPFAVRVAKTLSVFFGGGALNNSEGQHGESEIFGQPARWVDYSGPVRVGTGADQWKAVEGITFFDHSSNPRYPTNWHVREDGWMGASFCLHESFRITVEEPLTLRYLLHAHAGSYNQQRAGKIHERFLARPGFQVGKSSKRHQQYEVKRRDK